MLLFALLLSLSVELIQFLLSFFGNPRAVDIDDVILNTLGACIGFALYKSLTPGKVRRERIASVEAHSHQHDDLLADSADSEKR